MNSVSAQDSNMDNQEIDPRDIFYIREGGHGVFTLSIPPERLQEAAKAMFVLMRTNPFRGKSQTAIDAIVAMAQLVEEDEHYVEVLNKASDKPDNQ